MRLFALPLRSPILLPGEELLIECARPGSLALTREHGLQVGDSVITVPQPDATTERFPEAAHLIDRIGVLAEITAIENHGSRAAVTVHGRDRVRIATTEADPATGAILVETAPPPTIPEEPSWAALAELGPATADQRRTLLAADSEAAWRTATDAIIAYRERVSREISEVPEQAAALDDLWPLRPDGPEQIEARHRSGVLTDREAEDLLHFAEKGYVIWPELIDADRIAALRGDIESIAGFPGKFLTTDHRRGRTYRYSDTDFDAYESIFDLYVPFESARQVCFDPHVVRFLRLLFDARPVAMQQLLFQRSNGHHPHQDTAYVCIEQPMHLAATWIALEDVVAGRGELTYYEGSHRLPHMRFADGTKRFGAGVDDEPTVRKLLLERCAEHGCTKRDFLAKAGDVFLWAADLVHGSNPRTRPDAETRRSCVTHYCPETTAPLAMRLFPEHTARQEHGEALYSSQHYLLPVAEGTLAGPRFDGHLPA